jgi:hypothetical protein
MRQRRDPCSPAMAGSPYRAACRAVLRGAGRAWHDLRVEDLYWSGKEFELMSPAALDFAAPALLTAIPLLIVVAAVSPAPHRGLAVWVVYGMGLTGSSGRRGDTDLLRAGPGARHHQRVQRPAGGRLRHIVRGQRAGRV